MTAWRDYQEEAAAFFRSIGLTAETDVAVVGVFWGSGRSYPTSGPIAGFCCRKRVFKEAPRRPLN